MNTPEPPDRPEPPEQGRRPEPPESELDPRPEPFLRKLLRSTIAPDVLRDARHDAPLSPRGRILFWGTVSVLVVAIAVLFLVTASR